MNKTYQRASTPFNTMFYGIVCDDYKSAIVGCLGETCDCLRNKGDCTVGLTANENLQ